MVQNSANTVLSQAWAISMLGKAHHELATRHRRAAGRLAKKQDYRLTFEDHFRVWIGLAVELSAAAERTVAIEIDLAREHGVTWAQVGSVLGISRQSAWTRFAAKERWQHARPVESLVRAKIADVNLQLELSQRKSELIRELSDNDYTEDDMLMLERILGINPPNR